MIRMILIDKGGNRNETKNWRSITIYSVLRRIADRVLEKRLRSIVEVSAMQRVFTSIPGTHINASLINGVLPTARRKGKSCVVAFLDVSKAFDSVGHTHLEKCLNEYEIRRDV